MTILVSDSFNRANSTTGLGTTDSYNGGSAYPWTIYSPNGDAIYGIKNNQAYEVSGGTGSDVVDNSWSGINISQGDITVQTTFATISTKPMIVLRGSTYNKYIAVQPVNGHYLVYTYNVSTWTNLQTGGVPANGDVIKVTLNGSNITVYQNGTQIISTSTTFNQSETIFGINGANSASNTFDNFEIDSLITSGTTYIGSGTATGLSSLTSNETLILSEHGTVTGQSNNTSNETFVGAIGTTYSASGTVSGKSNLTSSETLILKAAGNAQGQSTLTSNEHEILSASGTIQGSSSLQSNETLIQHTGTIYSASGTVTGQSNASSHETMSLSANGEVKGQSSLTSNEKVIFFVTGISQGQSSLKSNEKLISVKQIISRVTLQGSRELHVILEGNRELNVILEGNRELHVILKGGADVPAENQNLTLEAGTDKIIDIPNIVDSTSPLDLTTCLEVHYQAKSGSTVISKDLTNGITVTSPTDLSIALLPDDSHGLSGFFKHEVWCVDSNGKKSLLTKGNLIIKPSYADVN